MNCTEKNFSISPTMKVSPLWGLVSSLAYPGLTPGANLFRPFRGSHLIVNLELMAKLEFFINLDLFVRPERRSH